MSTNQLWEGSSPGPAAAPPGDAAVLIATASDTLAALAAGALRQLGWPSRRTRTLAETEQVSHAHGFPLMLLDVRFCGERGHIPQGVRGPLNRETPVLSMARAEDWANPHAFFCASADLNPQELAARLAVELDQQSAARVLQAACRLVGEPSYLPLPSALAVSDLDELTAAADAHKRASKAVLRHAKALSDREMRGENELERLLPSLGPLPFTSLVNLVAARLLFAVHDDAHRETLRRIWRFSLARATAMRWLAARTALNDVLASSWVYDAGLFADAGAALLLWLAERNEPRFVRRWGNGLPALLAGHHEWVGERLLRRWRRSASMCDVAAAHHSLQGDNAVIELAVAAGMLVEETGVASDLTGNPDEAQAKHLFTSWRIGAYECRRIAAVVHLEVERIESLIAE